MKDQRMKPYRILLADDHVIFRQAMKCLIGKTSGLEVVGEAGDGQDLLYKMAQRQPDLVLLDITMPRLGGIDALPEITRRFPSVDILILTMHKSRHYLYHALKAGARGYLLKEDSDIELHEAIEKLRRGEFFVTRRLADELAGVLSKMLAGGKPAFDPLTRREKEVVKFVAEGKTNKEIAAMLGISIRTVENHRARVNKKLNTRKTAELVKYAIRNGITEMNA